LGDVLLPLPRYADLKPLAPLLKALCTCELLFLNGGVHMQSTTFVYRAIPGMDEAFRDRLIADLNQSLAGLIDLAAAYKQAHWNVIGIDFSQLHELFDEFAKEAREYMDFVAERTVTLGGVANGTLQAAAEETRLPPFPREERDEQRLLEELLGRLDQMDAELRRAMNESADDLPTQDVYTDVVRGIEKQRWMLQAHLAGLRHHQG
jgi:starvation-inducible DNA-binding protein